MKHSNDMTVGSPLKALVFFSLPLIIGNLFNHFYNVMDVAIVGNALGIDSLAAVGATSAIYGLFISITFGFGSGISLVIARYFGAKDTDGLKRAVAHTIKLSILTAIILTLGAIFGLKPLLILLRTPDVELSYRYISVILFFVSFMLFYHILAGILRAVGNSVAPLVFLIIGSLINIGMDYLFVVVFGWNVFGAGLATTLSQLFSGIITAIYLCVKCKDLIPSKEHFKFDENITMDLISNGLSMALMFSIVSIGSICLQFAINDLGTDTVAAHVSARKIDEMLMMCFAPLSTACATFASQNVGAKKTQRIKKGIATAFALGWGISVVDIIIVYTIGEFLVRLISGDAVESVVSLGTAYLKVNIPFFFFLVAVVLIRSTLQGLGRKIVPLIGSGMEMVGKVLIAFFLVPVMGYMGVMLSEPIIWIACTVVLTVDFVFALKNLNLTASHGI